MRAVRNCGCVCEKFSRKMKDYHADSEFALEFMKVLHAEKIDAVLSYDYFPLLSIICEINQIPYISWIYDCPCLTLQSKTIVNKCNYIFCFDRLYAERLGRMGALNCYHMPLGADEALGRKLDEIIRSSGCLDKKYFADISFVGSLYDGETNRLRHHSYSEFVRGYLDALLNMQVQMYGYYFVKESLTESVVREVKKVCELELSDLFLEDDAQLVADTIGKEVSARERELVLKTLGGKYEICLYSGSKLQESFKDLKVIHCGVADYQKEMPFIFYQSKINLNITSKTIESGIPLRVFDILRCRGFCITNYQPEIAEFFEDGKDLVMYSGMDDLLEKVEYYLTHENERKEIAENGYRKVMKEHALNDRMQEILNLVFAI